MNNQMPPAVWPQISPLVINEMPPAPLAPAPEDRHLGRIVVVIVVLVLLVLGVFLAEVMSSSHSSAPVAPTATAHVILLTGSSRCGTRISKMSRLKPRRTGGRNREGHSQW